LREVAARNKGTRKEEEEKEGAGKGIHVLPGLFMASHNWPSNEAEQRKKGKKKATIEVGMNNHVVATRSCRRRSLIEHRIPALDLVGFEPWD